VMCLAAAAVATIVLTAGSMPGTAEEGRPLQQQACGLAPTPGGMQSQILPSGREYMLYVPKQITYPAAVVFAWHGFTEKPQTMEDRLHLMALADAHGFLAVYPQAKNKGFAAAFNGAACCKNDPAFQDVDFAQEVVNALSNPSCANSARVFSFGFSNGGFLSHRIACENSNLFAAICPHSGLNGDYNGDLTKSPWTKCDTSGPRKVPVMGVHGTNDRIVPIAGGGNPGSQSVWFSFVDTMAIWERRHGCSDPKTEQLVGSDGRTYQKRSFLNCGVASLTVNGLGHDWWVDSTSNCMAFFRQYGL